jgi:hypothetical protein
MPRRTLRHAAAAAAAALAALLTAFATPAAATPAAFSTPAASTSASQQITLTAPRHAQAAQLNNIVVTYAGPAMNRKGCGDQVNYPQTFVIAWNADRDACEDAEIVPLSSMCGHGLVTSTCPFKLGLGLNNRYINRPIEAIVFYNEIDTCLATAPDAAAVLGPCPTPSGSGGANGTIDVWSASGYLVSRYWSNSNGTGSPSFLCNDGGGTGQALDTDQPDGQARICQWDNDGLPGT